MAFKKFCKFFTSSSSLVGRDVSNMPGDNTATIARQTSAPVHQAEGGGGEEPFQAYREKFLGSDIAAAARGAERLFLLANANKDTCFKIIGDSEIMYQLRQVLLCDPDSNRSSEKLQANVAYLVSAVAGSSTVGDAQLVALGFVVALVHLLSCTRHWGIKKGVLRAIARMLPSREATQQLGEHGGLSAVAAILDSDDTGLIRRCLTILIHVFSFSNNTSIMTEFVVSGWLGALVRLMESLTPEVQADAVEVLKLLCRLPETGMLLVEIGGVEGLARVAEDGHTQVAKAAARMALQRIQEASQGSLGWLPRVQEHQPSAHKHEPPTLPQPLPSRSPAGHQQLVPRPTCHLVGHASHHAAAPQNAFTPPVRKHAMDLGGSRHSPFSVLSPPGTAGSTGSLGSAGRASQHRVPCGRSSALQGNKVTDTMLTSESTAHVYPTGSAMQHLQVALWVPEQETRRSVGASRVSRGSYPATPGNLVSGRMGAGHSLSGGSKLTAAEQTDNFDIDAAPAKLAREEEGWLIRRTDIAICQGDNGKEVRLGEGGFGTVLKAKMNDVDEVAVKRMKTASPSAADLALFTKEVQVLRSLHHRNIVQYYGACMEPGCLFFVTELMKGGDLYTVLRCHPGTMAWGRLGRKIAIDVALGLNHLHTRRPPMMHRDLKSPNVLLSEEGVAKIADVGMVRPQVADLVTAQPIMTPLWAAPEVVRREKASVKADIWSYGILMWEIVTQDDITKYVPLSISKQLGPKAKSLITEGSSVENQSRLLKLPHGCPPLAARIFSQCTQVDPALRPSAAQIVEWLRGDN